MDLLLAEQQRGAGLAHALGPHAEHALVELDAAADIGDGDVQMVDTVDFHGGPPGFVGVFSRAAQISRTECLRH